MKEIKDWDKFRDQFVRETLRRASFRWPARSMALRASRTVRKPNPLTGKMCWWVLCNHCKSVILEREGRVDHVEPVIPVIGDLPGMRQAAAHSSLAVGSFVLRMFPESTGFQILCGECHARKTAYENRERRESRKLSREREGGGKGRQGEANVGSPPLEGGKWPGEGVNFRGQEVCTQWLAECPRCTTKVSCCPPEAFTCPKCGRKG